jgi:hypothetical protein
MKTKRKIIEILFLSILISLFSSCRMSASTPVSQSDDSQENIIYNKTFSKDDRLSRECYPSELFLRDNNGQKYLLLEDCKGESLVDIETSQIDNCTGIDPISITTSRSRTFSNSIELDLTQTKDNEEIIKSTLATYYNLNITQSNTYDVSVDLKASPGTKVEYTIEWVEEWREGRLLAIADLEIGRIKPINFHVKSRIKAYVPEPELLNCP